MHLRLKSRHRPSGQNDTFTQSTKPFAEYLTNTRAMIKSAYAMPHDENTYLEANAPYEWGEPNAKRGMLLIHGLFDSPFHLRDMATAYVKQGFLVRSILLPGHGTRPGDLLRTHYDAWCQATAFGLNSFQGMDEVFVTGYSTGGLLAMYHALARQDSIKVPLKGIIAFAPALKLKTPYAHLANIHKPLSRFIPRLAWAMVTDDNDYAKYESITFNSAHQVYLLSQAFKAAHTQHELSVPTYIILSSDDELIDSKHTMDIFHHLGHPLSRLLVYTNDDPKLTEQRMALERSALPAERILNYSHNCLAIDSNNPHYGQNGDYKDFRHYNYRMLKKHVGKLPHELHLGALTMDNLKNYYLQKLSYNPRFESQMESIQSFLERAGKV